MRGWLRRTGDCSTTRANTSGASSPAEGSIHGASYGTLRTRSAPAHLRPPRCFGLGPRDSPPHAGVRRYERFASLSQRFISLSPTVRFGSSRWRPLPMMAVTLKTRPPSANDVFAQAGDAHSVAAVPGGDTAVRARRGLPGGATCLRRRKGGLLRARSARARTSSSTTMRASAGPTSTRGSSGASLHAAPGRRADRKSRTARRMSAMSDNRSVARSLARCQSADTGSDP